MAHLGTNPYGYSLMGKIVGRIFREYAARHLTAHHSSRAQPGVNGTLELTHWSAPPQVDRVRPRI